MKKKSPKKSQKIEEALSATMQGGAIKKVRKKRSPKKKPKIDQALQKSFEGGRVSRKLRTYHDPTHKYLSAKLTGRGGGLDSALCRKKMFELMSDQHPSLFQSYIKGKVMDIPSHNRYNLHAKPKPTRKERRPDVIDIGGSMNHLSHSENGLLVTHDSSWYNEFEMI